MVLPRASVRVSEDPLWPLPPTVTFWPRVTEPLAWLLAATSVEASTQSMAIHAARGGASAMKGKEGMKVFQMEEPSVFRFAPLLTSP